MKTFYRAGKPPIVTSATTPESVAVVALREALKHLVAAQVRFDTGQTGNNWFKVDDVELRAEGALDPGLIIVRLIASDSPQATVSDGVV